MVGCSAVDCSNSSTNNNSSFQRLPKSIDKQLQIFFF